MPRTYEGILKNEHIEWRGESPPKGLRVRIHATVIEETTDSERGARMAASLSKLAETDAFKNVGDPVEWQRRIRRDRSLPGREEPTGS